MLWIDDQFFAWREESGDLRRPARLDCFFRGSNSSPDWVAGDASARYFVVLKTRKKTTKCTKMEFEDLSTREVFLPLISSCY